MALMIYSIEIDHSRKASYIGRTDMCVCLASSLWLPHGHGPRAHWSIRRRGKPDWDISATVQRLVCAGPGHIWRITGDYCLRESDAVRVRRMVYNDGSQIFYFFVQRKWEIFKLSKPWSDSSYSNDEGGGSLWYRLTYLRGWEESDRKFHADSTDTVYKATHLGTVI
jgi:hypothetical protein